MTTPGDRAAGDGQRGRGTARARPTLCWSTIAGLAVLHAGGVAGLVWLARRPSLPTVALAFVMYVLCGVSVTAGYHRLFAHRSFRASAPLRWAFLVFGAASFQNSAVSWSADHRAHHADTDGSGDPHAIGRGFWWAHVGWLLSRREASADVSRQTDLWELRSVRLQHRWCIVVAVAVGLVLPTLVAASWGDPWGGLLVAGFLRVTLLLQATFCVNSLAHTIGRRRYDASSSAGDSVAVALVTFGEGYHSYHHRFPYDYRNGARWWQFDPSKWVVWTLARVGAASRLRTASTTTVANALVRQTAPAGSPAPLPSRSRHA